MRKLVVRRRVVETAVKLMERAGISVEVEHHKDRTVMTAFLPPDGPDPHGERFVAALKELQA